ncbi:MAG: 4Fe-4S binding protein [Coriobacteriales bacterium]|nr:4Fe-4S binding protein [Coriobacteriales bacterium]
MVLALFLVPGIVHMLTGALSAEGIFYGTLSSSTVLRHLVLADPFAALEVLAASKQLPAPFLLIGAGLVALFYAIIRARAFCGWICPVGLFMEIVDVIPGRTRNNKAISAPRYTKVVVAGGVLVLSALTALPVFELVSPIGALSRGLVLGTALGFWSLVAVIVLEFSFSGRPWCRSLCPLGGFYELVGYLGFVRIKAHTGCTACDRCKQVCLANPRILDPVITGEATSVVAGDCMLCARCVAVCPHAVLHTGLSLPFT